MRESLGRAFAITIVLEVSPYGTEHNPTMEHTALGKKIDNSTPVLILVYMPND